MPDLGNVFLPPPPFADADADASAPPEDPVASDAAGAEPKWSRGLRVSMSTDLGDLLVPPPSSAPESLAEGPVTGGASVDAGPESDSGRGPQLPILTGSGFAVVKRERRVGKKAGDGKTSLEDHVRAWKAKKAASGAPAWQCVLPFLNNEPRRDDSICRLCSRYVFQEKEVRCTIGNCLVAYHLRCATEKMGHTPSKPFKCPQHSCFICKQKAYWRCVRCSISAHPNCAPWPNKVVYLENQRTQAVCWRHPSDWRRAMEHADPTSDVEEAFLRLPIPYVVEEFKVDTFLKDVMENEAVPAPYVHIRRNVYLIKRKRDYAEVGVGCTSCNANSTCMEDCECRCLSVSCSRSCHCSDMCRNRPFRKEKKIKVVKTEHCGWGVVALEAMEKGDFVIEYIGEVINDALCEQRLWDIKRRGDRNFYMCELQKDFTIDATFKGNASRFLNHSCDPNCKLEKWQVEGETRVGVFASRSIKVGEPLTYDYRFVHFGPMVECYCGASNCQGYLGSKKKINAPVSIFWGCKRQRSTVVRKSK